MQISTAALNFIQIGLGVTVLRMRDFAPLGTRRLGYLFWGGGFLRKATAETRAPILTQSTSNDAVPRKEVPFGGRETNIYSLDPIFPQNSHFWAPFRRDNFCRPKTALTLDGSRVNDPLSLS